MADHAPRTPEPEELSRAEDMWHGFTHISKFVVIGTGVILTLMALFLL